MSPRPAIDPDTPMLASYEAIEHELRTPLTSLRSLTEILRDFPDLTDAQRKRFLDSMIAENERLSRTVDQLLAWIDSRVAPLS